MFAWGGEEEREKELALGLLLCHSPLDFGVEIFMETLPRTIVPNKALSLSLSLSLHPQGSETHTALDRDIQSHGHGGDSGGHVCVCLLLQCLLQSCSRFFFAESSWYHDVSFSPFG